MIAGIGQDIIEVARIEKACKKEAFLKYCYTEAEIVCFREKIQSLAGNFAAKEAVAKALGTGFVSFGAKEIEVLRNDAGAPYICLYGGAKKRAEELGVSNIFVSISNLKEFATAMVVLEKS